MARDFDGVNDKIVLGTTQSFWNFMHNTTAKFSLIVWAKLNATDPDDLQLIFGDTNVSSANTGVLMGFDDRSSVPRDHTLILAITNGTGGQAILNFQITPDSFFPKDLLWHCIVWTYDQSLSSDNSKVTMDGNTGSKDLGSKTAFTPNNGDSTNAMHIGETGSGSFDADMQIAYVAILNSIITDNQIKAVANGVNPFALNIDKAYYPLHGNQDPEPNYVDQVHTGIVTGATKAATNPPVELLENYL